MNEEGRVRFMRLMVFFDLPVGTAKQRRDYRLFRKFLTKDGYLMLQESVYTKLVTNHGIAATAITRMSRNCPPEGLVQVLKVTERQFETMTYLVGGRETYDEVDTLEELLVL